VLDEIGLGVGEVTVELGVGLAEHVQRREPLADDRHHPGDVLLAVALEHAVVVVAVLPVHGAEDVRIRTVDPAAVALLDVPDFLDAGQFLKRVGHIRASRSEA
jgi:hypothetical protein